MNGDPAVGFLDRQAGVWIVVKLPAGDDVDFVAGSGQVKRKLGQDLAGRRMIREKVSIEKKKTLHCGAQKEFRGRFSISKISLAAAFESCIAETPPSAMNLNSNSIDYRST